METEIKDKVKTRLGEMVWHYGKSEYAEVVSFYETCTDWKSSEHALHPLFEDLRLECKHNIGRTVHLIIEGHISAAVAKLDKKSAGMAAGKLKIKELCRRLDVHEAVDCLNELFKMHANMMYSHHQIISFHERKQARLYVFLEGMRVESRRRASSRRAVR